MKLHRLKTPPLDKLDGSFSNRAIPQVEAWLDELPRGNAEALAEAVRDALQDLNRSIPKKATRFELAELLRPAVYDACAMLVARFKGSSLPLGEDEQLKADLVRQIYAELGTTFKLVVNEQIDALESGQAGATTTLTLQLATQRAILCLGRALTESYRIYAPEPPLLWRDLHTLYRNAELTRLQALPIEGTRDSDETALSIKQAYLRVAVLALANPYHLMQGEAEELYRRLGRWLHFVQIRPLAPGEELAGNFALDLGSDFPARYVPRGARLPAPAEPRLLDLSKLVQTVGDQIERSNEILSAAGQSSTLSERMQRDMYIRFRDAVGGRNERSTERRATVSRLILVEGLSACHFFLNGRRPFTPEQDESQWSAKLGKTDKLAGLKILDDAELNQPLPDPTRRTSRFQAHDAEADDIWRKANMVAPNAQGERANRRTRYRAASWNRKNESDGGMALFCPQDCPMQVRVGEVVVYANENSQNPADWRIGTIRWLRTRANGGLELGIKHLAKSGYALGTKAVSGPGRGSEYLRALLIPRVNPLLNTATLITPAGVYDVGTVVQLNMKDLLIYARLTELLETTRLFAHFRFKVVEAPSQESTSASSTSASPLKLSLEPLNKPS